MQPRKRPCNLFFLFIIYVFSFSSSGCFFDDLFFIISFSFRVGRVSWNTDYGSCSTVHNFSCCITITFFLAPTFLFKRDCTDLRVTAAKSLSVFASARHRRALHPEFPTERFTVHFSNRISNLPSFPPPPPTATPFLFHIERVTSKNCSREMERHN